MKTLSVALMGSLMIGSIALAHQGVKDPFVKARMHAMGTAGQATKVLGDMAKGSVDYDATQAAEAKAALIQIAQDLPALFQENASDPVSEARPAIWDDYADFSAKADVMAAAAVALDTSSAATIGAGLRALGGSCGGCHKAYRQKK